MNIREKRQKQIKMGLKYTGGNIFQKIQFRISKFSTLLDQYLFWRTPILWFDVFINIAASIFVTTWLYTNYNNLPEDVSLWYFFFDESRRFVSLTEIINLVFIHLLIQAITLLIAYKVSSRFRPLANFLLVCICIASLTFYIALYKSLSLVVT
ncbi:MAG: hypothetical protein ABIC57_01460 [bacterium]